MKTLDFSTFVVLPATIIGGEKISAVLLPDSNLGVAHVVYSAGGISTTEAREIADWLVLNSGRSAGSLSAEAKWFFSSYDTAFREVVASAWQSISSIELTTIS